MCDEWELAENDGDEERRLAKRGWLKVLGRDWLCRVCASLARASQLAAQALERAP